MEAHLFAEWYQALLDDGLFGIEDDESNWIVDETNAVEVIEALNFHNSNWLTEEELIQIMTIDD